MHRPSRIKHYPSTLRRYTSPRKRNNCKTFSARHSSHGEQRSKSTRMFPWADSSPPSPNKMHSIKLFHPPTAPGPFTRPIAPHYFACQCSGSGVRRRGKSIWTSRLTSTSPESFAKPDKRSFLLDRERPVFFSLVREKKMGGSNLDQPFQMAVLCPRRKARPPCSPVKGGKIFANNE